MIDIILSFFTDKYARSSTIGNNVLLSLMYRLAYPFALLLNKCNLTPNQITTLSLICSVVAWYALSFDEGWLLFTIFWALTVLFDFCDGTVARMTNTIGKTAFRYDHNSDLIKIFLLFLGTGLRYDDFMIWAFTISISFLFMYYTLLNHELGSARKRLAVHLATSESNENTSSQQNVSGRNRFIKWIMLHNRLLIFCKRVATMLLTINGHTLLLFFLLPLGENYTVLVFTYLGLVLVWSIRSRIKSLCLLPK